MPENRAATLRYVMLAVLVWGLVLALGAGLYGINPQTGQIGFSINPLRGLIVAAFVVGFVGLWGLAVVLAKSRQQARRADDAADQSAGSTAGDDEMRQTP